MSAFGKFEDGTPIPPCFSCAPDDSKFGINLPAEMIALVPSVKGGVAFAAPLCLSHSRIAMISGWYPQFKIESVEGRKAWDELGWQNPARAALTPETNHDRD